MAVALHLTVPITLLFVLFCSKLPSANVVSAASVSAFATPAGSPQEVQESSYLMDLFQAVQESISPTTLFQLIQESRFQDYSVFSVIALHCAWKTKLLSRTSVPRYTVLRSSSRSSPTTAVLPPTFQPILKNSGQESSSPTDLFKPILTDLSFHQEIQDSISSTVLFQPLLTNLDFRHLSMVIPSFFYSLFLVWTDYWCSLVRILQEHLVPEIFPYNYLRQLTSRTKLETMNLGRCIVVTSADNNTKIFVGGNVERMTSLSVPPQSSISDRAHNKGFVASLSQYLLMPLILRDAILRLHNNGFSIIYLAMWIKFPEKTKLRSSQEVQELISPTAPFQSLSDFARSYPTLPGNEEMEMVYLSLGFALVASAVGVYLHLLWTIGGLLTTLACFGNILWLLSTHAYEEKTRVSFLMATVFVGTVIALGCFSAAASLVTCSMQCLTGILKKLPTVKSAHKLFDRLSHRLRNRWFSGADSPFQIWRAA